MEQDLIPTDESARRAWLKKAGVHRIAAALNRAEESARWEAFDRIPEDKGRRVFSILEPPTQQGILARLDEESRDEEDALVGIITFDDAMEVLEFEETEDIARTGAAEPLARPYWQSARWARWSAR